MKAFLHKHRKILVMLPVMLLIIAGITMLVAKQFAEPAKIPTSDSLQASRFNEQFPSPNIRDKEKNKFEIYQQAQRDTILSARTGTSMDKRFFNPGPPDSMPQQETVSNDRNRRSVYQSIETQEKHIDQQLKKIMSEMNRETPTLPKTTGNSTPDQLAYNRQQEMLQIEQMIAGLQQSGSTGETEMQRLNTMLEKLVALEDPGRTDTLKITQDTIQYFQVSNTPGAFDKPVGFHSLPQEVIQPQKKKKAIRALALGGQELVNGSTVKLRLQEKIFLDQVEIPAFTQLDGLCRINDERLLITINQITLDGVIYPVKLSVYDMAGMQGLHVPGAITRDAAKEQMAQTIQSTGRYNLTGGVASEIASSTIQGMGNLLSRKARLVRVQIPTDCQVFLQ